MVIILSISLFGKLLGSYLRPIIQTVMVAWLLARFCDGQYLYYVPDIITVHFLMWQCTYVMCKWEDHDLSFPLLILQQVSFCTSVSLLSFLTYDYIYSFSPIQLNFALLWLWALYDM